MHLKIFSLPALLAVTLVLPLSATAQSSIDYNSSRSNASRIQDEIQTEVAALDAQLADLQQQMADIEARSARIESLQAELETAQADMAAEGEGLVAQYDEAAQLFADQIAPLLSPESVDAVTRELEAARQSFEADAGTGGADDSEIIASLGELGSLIDGLKGALDEVKGSSSSLDTAIKASWNLKENVK